MTIPVQAADEADNGHVITLSLTDAKQHLLEQNTDLKLLEISLDKLYYQLRTAKEELEELKDSQADYEDSVTGLKAQLANLENARAALIADQADPLTPSLPVEEYINSLINFDTQIARIKQSISSVTGSKNASFDAEDSLETGIGAIRNNIDSLKESEAITKEKLKYNLETVYLRILSLELEIDKKESTVSLARLAFLNETLKSSLGLTVETNVQNAEANYNTAQNSLDSLISQKEQLMNQLKVLMGYPISKPVKLADIPVKGISLPAYQEGLENALENGAEIKYRKMVYDNQKDYIEDLEYGYNSSEKEIRNEKDKLAEYKINLQEAKTNTENAYYNSYNNLMLLADSLRISENQLEHSKHQNDQNRRQYDLGIISKEELTVKEDAYLQAELSFNQKQYEYAIAVAAYYMAETGYLVN